jgi:hypothetical protein
LKEGGVSVEGVYKEDPADGFQLKMFARTVEAAFIAGLGGTADFVQIARAQCNTGKLELRIRGVGTVPGANISVFEHIGGVHGPLVAEGIVVDSLNEWTFRGDLTIDHCPAVIEAHSDLGGSSEEFNVRISN